MKGIDMKKRALISVYDKTGILDFAKFLVSKGIEIISTGGTYKYLKENNIEVIEVSKITYSVGSPSKICYEKELNLNEEEKKKL